VIVIQVKKVSRENTSLRLAYESLHELHGLYEQLDTTTKLIAESRGLPKYEAALILEEDEESGILDRATAALEKMQEAGEKLKKELKDYENSLPEFFENTKATLDVVSREIDTIVPKKGGLLSKIGTGLSSVTRALFGMEQSPIGKITQMESDYNMLKSMIDRGAREIVLRVQKDQKNALKDPEVQKQFEAVKAELMKTPFDKMKPEDVEKYELPNADEIKAILAAGKLKPPEGMFKGFKKLSRSLGITLGDVPFKKYLKLDELIEDFTRSTPEEVKSIFDKNPQATPKPTPSLQQVGQVLQDTQELKNDAPEELTKKNTVKDMDELVASFSSAQRKFNDPKTASAVIRSVIGKDKFTESSSRMGSFLFEADEAPGEDYEAVKLYKALAEKDQLPKKNKISFVKDLIDAIEKKFKIKAKGDLEKELRKTQGKKKPEKGTLKSDPDIEKAGEKKAPELAKEKLKPGEYAKYASGHVAVVKKGEEVSATIYADRKYKDKEGGSEEAAKKKALTSEAILFERWSKMAGIA
jgi:hypothetical protein